MTSHRNTSATLFATFLLLGSPSEVRAVDAASTDWVMDPTSGGLCGGQYLPPLLPDTDSESLEATGENTVFDGDDRVILVGNAQVARGPFVLKADQISFRNSTGDGDAAGQVSIRQPNALLTGTQASVNVRTSSFELTDATFVTHSNQLRGASRFAIGAPNGDIRIIDGRFTFCAPGDQTWDLKASDIALNQSSGRGWAEDVTLRVREIPVFYTPILGFPMDDRRLTGFLFPEIGSGTNGTEIVAPFYWNLAPATDALLQPRFMSDRGTALGIHARHLFSDRTLVDLKTEQLPDDDQTNTSRHGSRLSITSQPGKALVWWARTENVSDADFIDDVSNFANLSSDTQLSSEIGAILRQGPWQLSWHADQVDVIDPTVTGTAVRFARQPALSAHYAAPLGDWQLDFLGDATRFSRPATGLSGDALIDGDRFTADWSLSRPTVYPYGQWTQTLLAFQRSADATTVDGSQTADITTVGAALDGQLEFEKTRELGGLYQLRPRAKLLVREPFSSAQPAVFESSESGTESIAALYANQSIDGRDFVGDTAQLTLGVQSRVLDHQGAEQARFDIARVHYFADRTHTLDGVRQTESAGPVVLESDVRLTSRLRWNLHLASNDSASTLDTGTHTLKWRASARQYVTQRIVWDSDRAVRADLYASQSIGAWRALAGLQWDPTSDTRVSQVMGIEYDSCCWRAALVHAYEQDNRTTTASGQTTKLMFELKGLGTLGQGATQLLDRLLEDYERSQARD